MTIRYAEYPPSPRFARIVERYWMLEGHGTGSPDAVLPDGRLEVIFHYDQAHMALDFRHLAAVSPASWREHSGELAPLFAGG